MNKQDILTFMEKTAAKKGWKLTPDRELIGFLQEGFLTNLERYGYLQCPCREGSGERSWDRDILCPCDYSSDDLAEYGQCFCGLYLNDEIYQKGGAEGSIPERRPPEKFEMDS